MESETNSRKPCLIFKKNKFSKSYIGKRLTTWKCTIKSCSASIHTDRDGIIVEEHVTHAHEDKLQNIAAHKLKVAIKKKGRTDLNSKPSELVKEELEALGGDDVMISSNEKNAVKSLLWRTRRSTQPMPIKTVALYIF